MAVLAAAALAAAAVVSSQPAWRERLLIPSHLPLHPP